jgi:hypothetical protein
MNGQQTAKPRLIAGGVQAGFAAPSKAFENCPAGLPKPISDRHVSFPKNPRSALAGSKSWI